MKIKQLQIHPRLFGRLSNLSLSAKLVTVFLTITFLTIGVLAYWNNQTARNNLTQAANQALLSGASQIAIRLDDFITTNFTLVRSQAQLPVLIKYLETLPAQRAGSDLEDEVKKTFQALTLREQIHIDSYALLDRQGFNVFDSQGIFVGGDESGQDYFQEVIRSGQPYISTVRLAEGNQVGQIYFSAPSRNTAGEIIGVLRFAFNSNILQTIVRQNNDLIGPQSFAILFDEHHIHLAHGTQPDLIWKSVVPFNPERIAELQAARRLPAIPPAELSTNIPELEAGLNTIDEQPFFEVDLAATPGELDELAVVKMKTRPWFVVFAQPQVVYLAPLNTQTQTILMLAGMLAAVVTLISLGLARLLTGPITRLTAVAVQIQEGNLTAQAQVETNDEIGLLARAFNSMVERIQQTLQGLEDRSRRLEIIAVLSEQLSALLNLDDLLPEVVNQVKDKFGYYYVHIYLLDPESALLVMAQGIGEAGRMMKVQGHNIPLNAPTSLIAQAARRGAVVSVENVRESPDWLPNSLLPDTYAEMAVPIILEDQVVGVLDVQSDKIAGLDEGDANLLRSLANQVAVAIHNARLFEEVKTALVEVQVARERYLIQAWQQAKLKARLGRYHYARPNVPDLAEATILAATQTALAQPGPGIVPINGSKRQNSEAQTLSDDNDITKPILAPIKLNNQQIGALQIHPAGPEQIWSEDDLALVEAVVDQLAQTAENLRLFEATKQKASQEQTIREITEKLRAAPTLDRLLEIATEELGERLSATHANLTLGVRTNSPRNSTSGGTDEQK